MTPAVCAKWIPIVQAAMEATFKHHINDADFDLRRIMAMDETPFNPAPGSKLVRLSVGSLAPRCIRVAQHC